MDLKLMIEEYFKSSSSVITIKNLVKKFRITYENIDELLDILYELEKSGKIIADDPNSYIRVADDFYLKWGIVKKSAQGNFYIKLPKGDKIILKGKKLNSYLKEGDVVFVQPRKGNHPKLLFGDIKRIVQRPQFEIPTFMFKAEVKKSKKHSNYYVEFNNKKYYIRNLNGAYKGDIVTLVGRTNSGKYMADVKEIVERKTQMHVFEYTNIDGKFIWMPVGTSFYEINFKYNPNDYTVGDKILLKLDNNNNAELVKLMDESKSIESIVKTQAYDYGINVEFSKDVLEEIENLNGAITEEDIEKRVDLRNLKTVTIDPSTAKDLDDAISLERTENGYRLYVSIADVSRYVKPGTKTFEETLKRGTSIYPANMVIPMLPAKLSDDICSLNPNTDKLAKTLILDIDFEGNVTDRKIVKSIINSDYKMQYDKVNDYLNDGILSDEYIPFKKFIELMKETSDLLQRRRFERGYIALEDGKQDFIFDKDNNLVGVKRHSSGPAQEIIENFMSVANENIGDMASVLGVPFIYRNHEQPTIEKLYTIRKRLPIFNKYIRTLSNAQSPKIMQQIVNSILKGKTDYEKSFLSKLILMEMNRAYYSSINLGHYALALDCYATFTSPIRKLSDLLNHIILDYVIEQRYDKAEVFSEYFLKWAKICTETQYEAEKFEESIDGVLLHNLALQYCGEPLSGVIVFRYEDYVYVDTQLGFYGYIRLNKKTNENSDIIINGESYKVGSSIDVTIYNVDTLSNEIEFKSAKTLGKTECVLKRKKEMKNDKY